MRKAEKMQLLEAFGLTPVESLVYVSLLKKSPQTGYRVAAEIGKSRSNTYQALASLEAKRVIIRLQGRRHADYVPVPIREFADRRERDLSAKKALLIEALEAESGDEEREFIYTVAGTDQLYEKVAAMLREARSIVLVDTDAGPLAKIHDLLEARARAGVSVLVETPGVLPKAAYEHVELRMLTGKDTDWAADWLCLSVDGRQFLISLVDRDTGELVHGLWSGDGYIAPWIFNGMLHEMSFRVLMRLLEDGKSLDEIRSGVARLTRRYFKPVDGFVRLQTMLAARGAKT